MTSVFSSGSGSSGDGKSIFSKAKENKEFNVPLIKCPSCFGDGYMISMDFVCADCKSTFRVPATAITNPGDVVKVDPGQIHSDIVFEEQVANMLNVNQNDNNIKNAALFIQGPILEQLKTIQKKYKLKSVQETAVVLFTSMMEIVQMLEQTKSKYIGFINEQGTKSNNLKDGAILNKARRLIAESKQTSDSVNGFIGEMQKQFRLDAVKKFYDEINSEHTEGWDFSKNDKEKESG